MTNRSVNNGSNSHFCLGLVPINRRHRFSPIPIGSNVSILLIPPSLCFPLRGRPSYQVRGAFDPRRVTLTVRIPSFIKHTATSNPSFLIGDKRKKLSAASRRVDEGNFYFLPLLCFIFPSFFRGVLTVASVDC